MKEYFGSSQVLIQTQIDEAINEIENMQKELKRLGYSNTINEHKKEDEIVTVFFMDGDKLQSHKTYYDYMMSGGFMGLINGQDIYLKEVSKINESEGLYALGTNKKHCQDAIDQYYINRGIKVYRTEVKHGR